MLLRGEDTRQLMSPIPTVLLALVSAAGFRPCVFSKISSSLNRYSPLHESHRKVNWPSSLSLVQIFSWLFHVKALLQLGHLVDWSSISPFSGPIRILLGVQLVAGRVCCLLEVQTIGCSSHNVSTGSYLGREVPCHTSDISHGFTILTVVVATS